MNLKNSKFIFYFLICWFSTEYIYSQKKIIFDGIKQTYVLQNSIYCYEDTSHTLSIQEVLNRTSFKPPTNNGLNEIFLSFSNSDFWLKFTIENTTKTEHYALLVDNNPLIKYKELYVLIDDSIINLTNKLGYAGIQFYTFNNAYFITQLSLKPGKKQTYYIKTTSEGGPYNLSLDILSPSVYLDRVEKSNLINGGFYGILLILFSTSLLLWFSSKKSRINKYNFWFFMYIICVIFFFFLYDGYGIKWLWENNFNFNNSLLLIVLAASLIPVSLFVSIYFETFSSQIIIKRLFDFVKICSAATIVLFIAGIFNIKTTVYFTFGNGYILILSSFFTALRNYSYSPKFAGFFISALTLIVLSISLLLLHVSIGLLSNEWIDFILKTGFTGLLILITIGLVIRMRIKRERNYIIALEELRNLREKDEKLNIRLESVVKERTKLLISKQKQLEEANREKSKQNKALEIAFKKSSRQHVKLQSALFQINEQKEALEVAFKKSSSQHVKLQKALRLINEQKTELEKANEEISESARLKEIFLANTSHEIRTPLNAIIGFTNLLMKTDNPADQDKYIRNIKTSGENLMVIINDILDFSKIEAGKLRFENIHFDIHEILEQLSETLMVKIKDKGLKFDYNLDKKVHDVLIGDPYRLNQVLINLIGNAIKFTKPGGLIKLEVKKIRSIKNKENLRFSVIDNGIGIAKDKLKNIFNSFTQAESSTTRKYGGTGLGLAIVKQLVELQEGQIKIKSELDKGTEIIFELEFDKGSREKLDAFKPNVYNSKIQKLSETKLLLVEDNYINQQLAVDTINSWKQNIEIDLAMTGIEALEKVKNNNYDLILMDIQMPVMDGIEATKTIRQKFDDSKKDIPIIAMTAHAMKEEQETCKIIGMNDYITKPFNPDNLFRKIIYYSSHYKTHKDQIDDRISSDSDANIEQLDLVILKQIYGDDINKISKILNLYLESIPAEIIDMENFIQNGNLESISTLAHTLKTKMGYLGLHKLKDIFINLEHKKILLTDDKIKENLINKIKITWQTVENDIRKIINR